jgi:class 3 adenylate cyclase
MTPFPRTSPFELCLVRTLLSLSLWLVAIIPSASAKEPFTLTSGDWAMVTPEHIEFLEKTPPDTPLEVLQSADWKKAPSSVQTLVEGLWMKFQVQNHLGKEQFVMGCYGNFPSCTESRIHVALPDGTTHSDQWQYGDPMHGDDQLAGWYRVLVPIDEIGTFFYYVRAYPFDRRESFDDEDSILHYVIGIAGWTSLANFVDQDSTRWIVLMSVIGAFAVYYLIFFMVSKEINYFWLSMLSVSISLRSSLAALSNYGFLPLVFLNSGYFSIIFLQLIFIFGLQFSRSLVDLKESHPLLDRVIWTFQMGFLIIMSIDLAGIFNWPSAQHLDLLSNPPDGKWSGFLQQVHLYIAGIPPFLIWIYVSFKKWRGGSRSAGMGLFSLSPFLLIFAVNIFSDDWYFKNIVTQLVILVVFILLGLAVAQRMNDLKQLALEQQMRLTEAYQRFVPKQLLSNLEKESILDVKLGDQVQKEMSILFSDIRSFTTLSESMTPEENFRFVNSYLSRMGPLVREHHGYIDKYIGDAIMALFDRSPDDAVRTSVEMLAALREYNEGRLRAGYEPIRIGIGINTGMMMLGTLGEEDRMEGSVISDAVNLAARLEGLTKLYWTPLLVSEATRSQLTTDAFRTRLIDKVAVKGKTEPVLIHEVLDAEAPEERDAKLATLDAFNSGWELYQNQQFKKAQAQFQECLKQAPGDTVADLYVERCEALLSNGWDAENWDGVNRMDTK